MHEENIIIDSVKIIVGMLKFSALLFELRKFYKIKISNILNTFRFLVKKLSCSSYKSDFLTLLI